MCELVSDTFACFSGTFSFEEVMTMGSSREHHQLAELTNQLQFDDPINIQFTSVSATCYLIFGIFNRQVYSRLIADSSAEGLSFDRICELS